MSKFVTPLFVIVILIAGGCERPGDHDYPIRPVPFTKVSLSEGYFWYDRLETNRKVTIPYDFRKCEETGRISNFARAARLEKGGFQGIFFNDSDVYKVIEGAAYSLAQHPDERLKNYVDSIISLIAAAQEPDGYLYTNRTIDPSHAADGAGEARWTHLKDFHELYNAGHLYEAAVAWYEATGERNLLEVALKNADLVASVFGPGKNMGVPGHEEIEIGLVKLYRVTGERKYLDLARFFVEQRGHAEGHELYGPYYQDSLPVCEESEARGHAVRAGYLYSAVADVIALTGDTTCLPALRHIWNDVVKRKIYLTGGIGARREIEGFGDSYELPNDSAYNETCAAVANMLWNHRMFLLLGRARYYDVLEQTLYNGFLAGVSLSGDRFFYPNPLASDGQWAFNMGSVDRSPWFSCSCCPVNVVRFLPSLPGYLYAVREDTLFINLFMSGRSHLKVQGHPFLLEQVTDYPWSGEVHILYHGEPKRMVFKVRLPAWARGHVMAGGLYRPLSRDLPSPRFSVNGREVASPPLREGYLLFDRLWKEGDTLALFLPMPVMKIVADPRVEADRGKVAVQRGPLVYCVEGHDVPVPLEELMLPDTARLSPFLTSSLIPGHRMVALRGTALWKPAKKDVKPQPVPLTMIPYYAWDHRGNRGMRVWLQEAR